MKFLLALVILILSVAASPSVICQVYVGGSYGITEPYTTESDESIPDLEGDGAVRAFVGNRLSPKFAFEAGYTSFDEYEVADLAQVGFLENTLSLTGIDASVLGKVPLAKRLSLYGRLGVFYWEAERVTLDPSTGIRLTVVADEVDYVFGGGIEYRPLNHFGVLLDANSFNTDEVYHLVYGLGLFYNF